MKPKLMTDFQFVSPQFKVIKAILLAVFLAFGLGPSANAQNEQKDSNQTPAVLRSLVGPGRVLSHFFPGTSPVPYPELLSIDQLGPKDFGAKKRNCTGMLTWRTCSFGDKFNVNLLPGRHTLLVFFSANGNNNATSDDQISLTFKAESRHTYVVEAQYIRGGWSAFIADYTDPAHPLVVSVE